MQTRRLIVATPEGERELLFIGRLSVGRATECDISLADSKISRRHAEFDATGPVPRVTDLGSRNGILVNGKRVGSAELIPGDVVTVGDAQIRVEAEVVAAPSTTPSHVTDDRTAVLVNPYAPSTLGASAPAPPMPGSDRSIATPPPDKSGGYDGRPADVTPTPGRDRSGRDRSPSDPPATPTDDRTAVIAMPSIATPPPDKSGGYDGRPADATPTPGRDRSGRDRSPSGPTPAPVSAPAASADKSPSQAKASRFSWGGLVSLACVALGGLAVLLGAIPTMSSSASALEALSTRQARTLAGWLASGVGRDGGATVDADVMDAVLSQPGVSSAVVLDASTGRAVAPSRLVGRRYQSLPVVGTGWASLSESVFAHNGSTVEAVVPVRRGAAQLVVWVQYERPSGGEAGVAVVVALIATLALALVMGMLIKRRTASTMAVFTRQVELAVSGSSPKVMQGHLLPGLERLPGVIAYVIEQRKLGGGGDAGALAGVPSPEGIRATIPEPVIDPGPAWLDVTPSLAVAEASPHAPLAGVRDWPSAAGRHLLDVLEPGPMCNAVVQGLGALGNMAGAEVVVPVAGQPAVTLRREPSTHVRVELAAR